jgi:hypothetical protein
VPQPTSCWSWRKTLANPSREKCPAGETKIISSKYKFAINRSHLHGFEIQQSQEFNAHGRETEKAIKAHADHDFSERPDASAEYYEYHDPHDGHVEREL